MAKLPETLLVTMKDGSTWGVPVSAIANHRAEQYKGEFDGDLQRSLDEDTLTLFEEDQFEIQDWAANNMDWDDVKGVAVRVSDPQELSDADFQDGWVNGEKMFA